MTQNTTEAPTRLRWLESSILLIVLAAILTPLAIYGPFHEREEPQPGQSQPATTRRAKVDIALSPVYDKAVRRRDIRPVLRYLDDKLLIQTRPRRFSTTKAAIKAVVDDSVHIAILPALACAQARHAEPSLKLLVSELRTGHATTKAVVVVPRDSPHQRVQDLRGQPVCLVDPSSMSGDLLLHLWLRSRGLRPDRFFSERLYSGSHRLALRNLRAGRCAAAAVSQSALSVFTDRAAEAPFRSLAITGHAPAGCWIASSSLSAPLAESIELALLNVDDELHTESRSNQRWISGFQLAEPSTYRAVEVAGRLGGRLRLDLSATPRRSAGQGR